MNELHNGASFDADTFQILARGLFSRLQGAERCTLYLAAEWSDFVRFNHHRVRQAGSVLQSAVTIELFVGKRHAATTISLTGNLRDDRTLAAKQLAQLRQIVSVLPEDPYLLVADTIQNSTEITDQPRPDSAQIVATINATRSNADLVGILASGTIFRGFASSWGQSNWFSGNNFNFDWSLHLSEDQAIKARYAGATWHNAEFADRMTRAEQRLELLNRPTRNLKPDTYRVILAPEALEELMSLLAWDAFGLQAQRTGRSPLRRLIDGDATLDQRITLTERGDLGFSPIFQPTGEHRPSEVTLIDAGTAGASLVGPRSAIEYGVAGNGANAQETPNALVLAPGTLSDEQALESLDTGLYISNLWYLNHSDRNAGRITGMTRFGTFWVKQGRLAEPVNPMRFDDTLYQLLGDQLAGIGAKSELLMDTGTYQQRSTRCMLLPSIVISKMKFTL